MKASFQTLRDTYNELISDVEHAKSLDTNTYSEGFIKRTYTRAYFAMVEGVIAQLSSLAIQINGVEQRLSTDEIALLSLLEPFVGDNGRVKTRKRKTPMKQLLLHTLKSFCKVVESDVNVDIGNHRWEDFLHSIRIRDRLTHPKNLDSLNVSDDDMMKLGRANEWFRDTVASILDSVTNETRLRHWGDDT